MLRMFKVQVDAPPLTNLLKRYGALNAPGLGARRGLCLLHVNSYNLPLERHLTLALAVVVDGRLVQLELKG